MIFSVNHWVGVYLMKILGWNWLSETHGNLADLSSSDHRVNLSKGKHNLNWIYLRHLNGVQDMIWTSYVCSMNCINTGILLSFGMGRFKIINFWKSFCWSLKKPLNSDWVRAVFCMLINIQCCYYLRWTKCQKIHFL